MSDTSWTGVSGKTYTLDLNGYKIADGNMYDEDSGQYKPHWSITVSDMALTIKDGSAAGDGRLDNLVMSAKGKLTLESGWLGHLTVPKDETVQVTLQGGGLMDYDSQIPLATFPSRALAIVVVGFPTRCRKLPLPSAAARAARCPTAKISCPLRLR